LCNLSQSARLVNEHVQTWFSWVNLGIYGTPQSNLYPLFILANFVDMAFFLAAFAQH
jgi:hypothetical protein